MTTKTTTPRPTDWHTRPSKSSGSCPICGCPGGALGQHRRVSEPDELYPRFEKRSKGPDGWRFKTIDTAPRPRAHKAIVRKPVSRPKPGPSEKTRERIGVALRMRIFQGKTRAEIAEHLGVRPEMLYYWRRSYRTLWDAIETELTNQIVQWTRQAVGTDAITQDVDLYLARASTAEKWCQAAEVPLFPTTEEPTLCSFFESYYLPTCLSDASPSTIALYRLTLRRWLLLTGDPPLTSIDVLLLTRFRDALAKTRGQNKWSYATPTTVAGKMQAIQTVLDKAGPSGHRNRDAAEILEKVPWVRAPRTEARPVRLVDPKHVSDAYRVACCMDRPVVEDGGLKPGEWWRALLVVAWNTGLRRRSLLELDWDMVDWERRFFRIPGRSMKAKRFQIQPFPEVVLTHLRGIRRSEHGLIFPWPMHIREFSNKWHELLDLAGIPVENHFGLHDIRKTLATTLWGNDPQAAQFALGHASATVTARHYVSQTGIVAAAVDAIEQPEAFGAVTPEELVSRS